MAEQELQPIRITREEAKKLISDLHAKHVDDKVECPMCGDESKGTKVVDDFDIYALATLCCSEPLSKYQSYDFGYVERLLDAETAK